MEKHTKTAKPKTEVGSFRLPVGYISMLRAIMRHHGRAWFEAWIKRMHAKLPEKEQS